jgi:hypothetical protein
VTRPDLSAEDILAVLNRHQVDYIVIGAFAAIAQGAPLEATHDVDVTPRREAENLRRLSAALTEPGVEVPAKLQRERPTRRTTLDTRRSWR